MLEYGRFSGATRGPCIGHITPEAAVGGPIALVQPGDRIEIEIHNRCLDLLVPENEIAECQAKWQPYPSKISNGFLGLYRRIFFSGRSRCNFTS